MRSHFSAGGLLLAACLLFSFSAFAAPNENVVHPNTVLASLRSYPPQINNGGGGSGTVTSVSGTTNQIDVATGTTTPVISIDPVLQLPGSLAVSDFTVGVTAHTLVAGASGLVDLSSEAAGGLKVPVAAGCTAAANGNICDDTTRGNFHVRAAGGLDSIVLVTTALPSTVGGIMKSTNTSTAALNASALTDTGSAITSTEPIQINDSNNFGANIVRGFQPCETAEAPTTLATGATTTDTGLSCLPANSIIDAVVARVTTTITAACTGWSIGDATTAARFATNNTTLTAGTTTDAAHIGTFNNTGIASATAGIWQAAAAKVRITCAGGNPGAGAIRIGVFYHLATAPTS